MKYKERWWIWGITLQKLFHVNVFPSEIDWWRIIIGEILFNYSLITRRTETDLSKKVNRWKCLVFMTSKAAPNKIVFWDSDRDILILTEILFKPSLNSALRGGEILFVGLFWLFRSRKQTNMQQTMCCYYPSAFLVLWYPQVHECCWIVMQHQLPWLLHSKSKQNII